MATTMQGDMVHTSLRMTMAAARAAQRASDWKTGDPAFKPAWHDGNLNKINMEKARPKSLIQEGKTAVPTLAELNFKEESKMRCFHPSLQKFVVEDKKSRGGASQQNSLDNSTSFSSRRSVTRSNAGESHGRGSVAGDPSMESMGKMGGTLGMLGDKHSATLRKQQLMEQRHNEINEKRIAALHEQMRKTRQKKEDDFTKMYKTLKEEKDTFVKDLSKYLDNKSRAAEQKRKALHTEWTECVFNKIQDQLLDRIDTMDEEEIAERRRKLFQNYM